MLKALALALNESLQDEYKARATYRAIIQAFGPVRPFINIVEAEERHIQALLPLFARYNIPVPADDWPSRVTVPVSLAQACREGVQAEVENGTMYERLLTMTANYPDVQRVFRNLQRASQQQHLPAFQRCAARGAYSPIHSHGQKFGMATGCSTGATSYSTSPRPGDDKISSAVGRRRRRRRRQGRRNGLN